MMARDGDRVLATDRRMRPRATTGPAERDATHRHPLLSAQST